MSGQSLLSNANVMPARAFTLTIGENAMSINMISKAWNVKLNSPIQKLVLMALAEKADNKGRVHDASRKEVAAMCELPVHTVHDAFAALMDKGFVCRLDAFSDVYVVMLPEG